MQIQDDISPRQKVTCRKGGSELSSPTSKPEQTRAPEHRPEHWPGAVLELSWLLNCSQSLQSFGSGCLQLSKTLPRHGSGINRDHCQQEAWSWLLWEVRVFLKALLYHLRPAAQTYAKRMEMLDPGFPACLGSLETKLQLFLSFFNACHQTTATGGGQYSSHYTAPALAENELCQEQSSDVQWWRYQGSWLLANHSDTWMVIDMSSWTLHIVHYHSIDVITK